jgi:hypothetical protein
MSPESGVDGDIESITGLLFRDRQSNPEILLTQSHQTRQDSDVWFSRSSALIVFLQYALAIRDTETERGYGERGISRQGGTVYINRSMSQSV